jgi:hypothetical protein
MLSVLRRKSERYSSLYIMRFCPYPHFLLPRSQNFLGVIRLELRILLPFYRFGSFNQAIIPAASHLKMHAEFVASVWIDSASSFCKQCPVSSGMKFATIQTT